MATDFNTFSVESLFIGLVHSLMHKIQLVVKVMHLPACSVTWCNSAILISNSLRKNPSIILLCALHMYMEAANKVHARARQEGEICSLVNTFEMRGRKISTGRADLSSYHHKMDSALCLCSQAKKQDQKLS